jgi:hypothetical protein
MTEPNGWHIGQIVHLRKGGRCVPAMIVRMDEEGTWVKPFTAADERVEREGYEPYVSLDSARPTSGWHGREEHPQALV